MRQREQPPDVAALSRAARKSRAADAELRDEIFRAAEGGGSLRAISEATGLSHEKIRMIVKERREWAVREGKILDEPFTGYSVGEKIRLERQHARRRDHLDYLLGVKKPDNH